jgi:hypothetical protein
MASQLKLFETKAIAEFDGGKIANDLNAKLKQAIADCMARPQEKRIRKVVLQIELKPVTDSTSESQDYTLQMRKNGSLVYCEDELADGDA